MRGVFFLICLCVKTVGFCSPDSIEPKKIVIIGAGYVGVISGACLAKCGHKISFIESDMEKVKAINGKKSPIVEPELEELICQGIEKGLITAQCTIGKEIVDADIVMIAINVLTSEEGTQSLRPLESLLDSLQEAAKKRVKPLVVALRSTVLPTSFRKLEERYFKENSSISLVIHPEFLRESTAVEDFFHSPFIVAGGNDSNAVNAVLSLYKTLPTKKFAVNGETACLLKYACNAFHAVKIVFANEIANICESLAINPREMMALFCEDNILNCSSSYLKPGFSFGGSCLTKDLKAFVHLSHDLCNPSPLLSAILPSNSDHFHKVLQEILRGKHSSIAVLGLSFKKNSGDLRESPFVHLVECFLEQGLTVHIFDPDVVRERLESTNSEIVRLIPFIKSDLTAALEGCDAVVACKDLLDIYHFEQLKNKGIKIYNLGTEPIPGKSFSQFSVSFKPIFDPFGRVACSL